MLMMILTFIDVSILVCLPGCLLILHLALAFRSCTAAVGLYVTVFVFCLLLENIPAELRDPFYCDQYEQEHLKPPVARLLQSSDLYCRTYSLLLGGNGAEAQPKDNVALLQLFAGRGLVSKDQDTPVTDADLRHKPIKMVKLYRNLQLWDCYGDSKRSICIVFTNPFAIHEGMDFLMMIGLFMLWFEGLKDIKKTPTHSALPPLPYAAPQLIPEDEWIQLPGLGKSWWHKWSLLTGCDREGETGYNRCSRSIAVPCNKNNSGET